MTFFRYALLTAIAAAAFVMPSQAATVTWDFTGAFATTDYGPHGTNVAGSVTFNTDNLTATSFAFTVSGYPGGDAVNYSMVGTGFVDVRNDEGGNYDFLSFRVPVTMSGPISLTGSLP